MANPQTPAASSSPIPPIHASLPIVDANGKPTTYFLQLMQLMWAAIQGSGGIMDSAFLDALLAGDGEALEPASAPTDALALSSMASDNGPEGDKVSNQTLMLTLTLADVPGIDVPTVKAGSGITVSQSGNVITISLANILTNRILANISGSSGAPTQNSMSDILDAVFSDAVGTLLMRRSTGWGTIAIGANGTVLTSNGTTASWV